MSVFGVILVRVFPSVRMLENTDHNNSEYGHFLSSGTILKERYPGVRGSRVSTEKMTKKVMDVSSKVILACWF